MNISWTPISEVTSDNFEAVKGFFTEGEPVFHCKLASSRGDIYLDVPRSEIEALVKQLNGFLEK